MMDREAGAAAYFTFASGAHPRSLARSRSPVPSRFLSAALLLVGLSPARARERARERASERSCARTHLLTRAVA